MKQHDMKPFSEHLASPEAMETVRSRLAEWVGEAVPERSVRNMQPFLTEGKMLRARLLLWLAATRPGDAPFPRFEAAALIELLHLASLLHDDVMDRASLRRGHGSFNRRVGDSRAVWTGDLLLLKAIGIATDPEWGKAREQILLTLRDMIHGQMLEWMWSGRLDLPETVYLQVLDAKTGSLFALAAQWGVAGFAGEEGSTSWRQWGLSLGRLFQLGDDCLDVWSPDSGKRQGQDWREGRMTLPTIILRERAPHAFQALVDAGVGADPSAFFTRSIRDQLESSWSLHEARFLDMSHRLLNSRQREILPLILDYLKQRRR